MVKFFFSVRWMNWNSHFIIHNLWKVNQDLWTSKIESKNNFKFTNSQLRPKKKKGSKLQIEYHKNSLNSHISIHNFWDVNQELWTCHIQSNYQLLVHKFTIILNEKKRVVSFKWNFKGINLNSLNWIHIFWDMSKEWWTCNIQSNY